MAKAQSLFDRFATAGSRGKNPLVAIQTAASRAYRTMDQLAKQQERYAKALNDPKTRRAAADTIALDNANRKLLATQRERLTLEARRIAITDGSYARELRSLQAMTREREKIERLERRATLTQRYGRVGGAVADFAGSSTGQAIGNVAQYASSKLYSSTMSGFGGTVELMRMQTELQIISRELAGSFRPAMMGVTKAFQGVRKRLETASPGQQDTLMYGGLALAGGLGAHALSRGLLGVGLGTVAARTGGAFAGLGGAGALAGGVGLGAVAGASGYGREVLGGAALLGAGVGAYNRTGMLKGAARAAAPIAVGMAGYEAATGGYYSELRKRGNNKLVAGLGSLGGGFMDLLSGGAYGDAFRKKYGEPTPNTPNPDRRMVTIADAGFDSPGTAFERITNALALRDAQDAEESPQKKAADTLERIEQKINNLDFLTKQPVIRSW